MTYIFAKIGFGSGILAALIALCLHLLIESVTATLDFGDYSLHT